MPSSFSERSDDGLSFRHAVSGPGWTDEQVSSIGLGGWHLGLKYVDESQSEEQVNAILSKTNTAAQRGKFEAFKTSSIFDGTAENPGWLGEEPKRLQELMPS